MMNEEIGQLMDEVQANPEIATKHVEGVDPNGAAISREQMEALLATKDMHNEISADVFTQEIDLPSAGYFGGPSKVKIRRMTIKEEEILYLSDDNPTYLDDLALSCIVSPKNISLDVLHPNDILYILYAIRNISFENTYQQRSICPACGQSHNETIDITKLPLNTLDKNTVDVLKEVTLPDCNKTVTLNIMTEGQLLALDDRIKAEIRKNKITNIKQAKLYEFRARREASITALDGELFADIASKRNFINSLSSRDYNRIVNASASIRESFGLDRTFEVKCPFCSRLYESEATIVPEFFRPMDAQ